MSTIWEAQLREELRQDDPGPPAHRWWGPLIEVWADAVVAGANERHHVAALVLALAREIGDTELAAIANRVVALGGEDFRIVIELNDELMKRSNAAKRMGRKRGDH